MWDKLFSTVDNLNKGLDATWLRNEVIMNNISNADTPGFKASQVQFEDVMASAIHSDSGFEMKTTRKGHIGGAFSDISDVEAEVITDTNTSYRSDENNVDIESQMVSLAQNSLEYYTMVNKINSEFTKLNMAIKGNA